MAPVPLRVLEELRDRIARIEKAGRKRHSVLPFGVAAIDACLPEGGLALGALHEIAGGRPGAAHSAAAALFIAGVLARLEGPVLWCLRRHDLFAPALDAVGLPPDRVIYAEANNERALLASMEEGLRHAGLAGVVGEAARLPMTASRRLQLAAEASGVTAFVIHRRHSAQGSDPFVQPSAAVTRWRIATAPSSPLPVPGIGRPRWSLELVRCRGGEGAIWNVEACDEQGRLALPARLADRSAAPAAGHRRASA